MVVLNLIYWENFNVFTYNYSCSLFIPWLIKTNLNLKKKYIFSESYIYDLSRKLLYDTYSRIRTNKLKMFAFRNYLKLSKNVKLAWFYNWFAEKLFSTKFVNSKWLLKLHHSKPKEKLSHQNIYRWNINVNL